jgi:hypothetical protein
MTTAKTIAETNKSAQVFLERLVELSNECELPPYLIINLFGLYGKMAVDSSVDVEGDKPRARQMLIEEFHRGLGYEKVSPAKSAGIAPPQAGADPNGHGARIAQLAATIASQHIVAAEELGEYGLEWQDIAFAGVLALRSLALMKTGSGEAADEAVKVVVDLAMSQQVIAKRFKSEAEMQAWAAQEGLEEGYGVDVPTTDAPSGPLH